MFSYEEGRGFPRPGFRTWNASAAGRWSEGGHPQDVPAPKAATARPQFLWSVGEVPSAFQHCAEAERWLGRTRRERRKSDEQEPCEQRRDFWGGKPLEKPFHSGNFLRGIARLGVGD